MLSAMPALADSPAYSDVDPDGSVTEIYVVDGKVFAIILHADGSVSYTDNPNPEGDGKGTGKPDYKEIVKRLAASKGGLKRTSKATLFNTVLKGKGIVPLWNPSDLGAAKTGDTGAGAGSESGHDANWAKGQAQKGSSSVKKGAASPNGQHGEGGDVNGHKAPDNSNGYTIKPELVNPAQASKK
jgi:hypothetical protein